MLMFGPAGRLWLYMLDDLRHAIRSLLAQPLWTFSAIACLAIGTGANTTGLSVINAILLRPLPFADAGELAVVRMRDANPRAVRVFTLAEYRDVAPHASLFSDLAARTFLPVSVSAGDPARMVQSEMVSDNYFRMLRLTPLAGRFPVTVDEAIVSERLWRGRFARDPSLVGRVIRVNGREVMVTGIAPEGFTGVTQLIAADMWLAADFAGENMGAQFGVIGRLQSGTTLEQARLQLDAILARTLPAQGRASAPVSEVDEAAGFGFPLAGRAPSALLFGLAGLVMGVAVANVAGLMLARAPGRRREIGVRLALGATAPRIVRMILVESLVLGFVGSAIGAGLASVVAYVGPGLDVQLPEHLTYVVDVRPDGRVFLYSAMTAVVVSIAFGLAPARQAARTNLVEVLKHTGTHRASRGSSRALNALVIGQMAISTALLLASGLIAKTYVQAAGADPGIDTRNALSITMDLDQAGYDASSGLRFYRRLLDRVAALPGIETAVIAGEVPLVPSAFTGSVSVESTGGTRNVERKAVTPGFFDLFRIPLLLGRDFVVGDRRKAIVNETMAAQLWPGRSAAGETFRLNGELLEVIGVVKDTRYRSLVETPRAAFYCPLEDAYRARMGLLVRAGDVQAQVSTIRRAIQLEDPDLAVVDVRTMDEVLDGAIAPRRRLAQVLATICGLALVLSAAGLNGVVAFGVRERAREFGLRVALGALPRDVTWMVLRRGLRLALAGFLIGLAASFGLVRLLSSVIAGVGLQDTVTAVVVGCVLMGVALAASYLPARWATRVDPAVALRND